MTADLSNRLADLELIALNESTPAAVAFEAIDEFLMWLGPPAVRSALTRLLGVTAGCVHSVATGDCMCSDFARVFALREPDHEPVWPDAMDWSAQ